MTDLSDTDYVDLVARVALAIQKAGPDHAGDVESVHGAFLEIIRRYATLHEQLDEGATAMTTGILTTARALLANCTGEGKLDWWLSENDGGICCGPDGSEALEVGYTDMNEGDNALVLAAPTLVRQLVAECERLRNKEIIWRARAAYLRSCANSGERPTEDGDRLADEHASRLISEMP